MAIFRGCKHLLGAARPAKTISAGHLLPEYGSSEGRKANYVLDEPCMSVAFLATMLLG